jgi:hypothetical protein
MSRGGTQKLEPYHVDTTETLHGFAALREAQGDLQEAVSLYRRALAIRKHVFGPQHPKTLETYDRVRTVLVTLGKTEEVARLDLTESKPAETEREPEAQQEGGAST